jgi:3'-5' exonuclease
MKIVLDIETLAPTREQWAELQGVRPGPWDDDSLFSDPEEVRLRKDYERAAFDATFSRIVCIGAVILNDDLSPLEAVAWYGDNEEAILRQFWARMALDKPRLFITFNGLGFDLPFLKKRSVIRQVKPTLEVSLARFRTDSVYDIMAVWANWDNRSWVKLDVLARALGVESKSGSGAQVAGMWKDGKKEEVAAYCLQDVYVTYACFCRMVYQEPAGSSAVLRDMNLISLE